MKLVSLLLGLFTLVGCASRPTEPTVGTAFVRIERTACFGSCPVYVLTVYADGFVRFDGRQFVQRKGTFTNRIQPSAVVTIFAKAEAIGFWSLADSYFASREVVKAGEKVIELPPTDMPACYVTVSVEGRIKRIQHYWGAPAGLRELEQLIDRVGGAAHWVGREVTTKKPNEALEPTSTAGNTAAVQPRVPAALVAHL